MDEKKMKANQADGTPAKGKPAQEASVNKTPVNGSIGEDMYHEEKVWEEFVSNMRMVDERSFADRLYEYRKAQNLTQRQMAPLLGVTPNHVGVLERGLKQPRATTLAKFELLSRKREIRRITDGKPMNRKEIENFAVLWTLLDEMSADRRREVMHVFRCILKWFK